MEEFDVPDGQRFLMLVGVVRKNIGEKVFQNFDSKTSSSKVCCFVSFAYADIPLGKIFDIVFCYSEPEKFIKTKMRLAAVTQQFAFESDGIPSGWKTICIFDFPNGIPEIITNLPEVESWWEIEIKESICICCEEDYEQIKGRLQRIHHV